MRRQNCWEAMACGREPGGKRASERGICPAAASGENDGANRGKFRGRVCWLVTGTLCGGQVQGAFAKKMAHCLDCAFLKRVQDDEGRDFFLIANSPRKH